jgi:hypothetical protein
MREIAPLDPSSIHGAGARAHGKRDQLELKGNRRAALLAVQAENKLASVDRSELSSSRQMAGKFQFSFESETQVSWSSSASLQLSGGQNGQGNAQMSFTTSFSLSFEMTSSFEVSFGEGLSMDSQQLRGPDFEYDRSGLLKLLEELIEKLSAQDRPEIDRAGELDDRALELLEKLGLLDENGQATPALQLLSDYAGLDRFHAGQQVRTEMSYSYSAQISSSQLGWQGWTQRQQAAAEGTNEQTAVQGGTGGANVVSGNQVGGDVNIDDRDNIHINIHNK